jgi:hypothetical protein
LPFYFYLYQFLEWEKYKQFCSNACEDLAEKCGTGGDKAHANANRRRQKESLRGSHTVGSSRLNDEDDEDKTESDDLLSRNADGSVLKAHVMIEKEK